MAEAKPKTLVAHVDRIEEKIAVIILNDDDKVQLDLPLKYLPKGIKEGDHLRIGIEIAPEETESARKRIKKLQQELIDGDDSEQKNFKL
jgi:hypothetical protein